MNKCLSNPTQMVLLILGVNFTLMIVGGGVVNFQGREVPSEYWAIISMIAMALVGLLKSPQNNGESPAGTPEDPTSIIVENTASNRVPVTEEK